MLGDEAANADEGEGTNKAPSQRPTMKPQDRV